MTPFSKRAKKEEEVDCIGKQIDIHLRNVEKFTKNKKIIDKKLISRSKDIKDL